MFEPIERRTHILCFSKSVVVIPLAEPSFTEVETQHREPKSIQRLHGMEDHFVVHRPAIHRMGMTDQGGVTRILRARMQQGFQPSCRAVDEQRTNSSSLRLHE